MRFDARMGHSWNHVNQAMRREVGCSSKVMAFRGTHQALFEICLGLHLKYSHKRKIVANTGFGDHIRNTEVELAKLGVRFKDRFEEDMDKEAKACLAYIQDLDDSITGELYNNIPTLKKLVNSKMIRIHVAHHLFHFKKSFVMNLTEFDICICALNEQYALAFCGDKVTLPQLAVSEMKWGDAEIEEMTRILNESPLEDKSRVQDFESQLPEGVVPWFTSDCSRIFDRALIILKEQDGSAFIDLLAEKFDRSSISPGELGAFESTSYCRWKNKIWFDQAEKLGRDPNDFRGLVGIASEALNENFQQTFNDTLIELNKLSQ